MIPENTLSRINNVFLDTAPIIYYIEAQEKYGSLIKNLIKLIKSNEISIFSSVISLTEVLIKPIEEKNKMLMNKFSSFLRNKRNITLLQITEEIAENAGELCGKYKFLKTADALQIASAIKTNINLFITNDIKLKKIKEIKVLVLNDYL